MLLFDRFIYYFLNIRMIPNANKISPCAMSPNITPNKKGNVTVVNMDGFISL
jgi:hypothetical protein